MTIEFKITPDLFFAAYGAEYEQYLDSQEDKDEDKYWRKCYE